MERRTGLEISTRNVCPACTVARLGGEVMLMLCAKAQVAKVIKAKMKFINMLKEKSEED